VALLRLRVQWDVVVTVFRLGGMLLVTPYAEDPDLTPEPLLEPVEVLWPSPLVLGGVLPAGAVGVRGAWPEIQSAEGVWLARADGDELPDPLGLEFVYADGHAEAVPAPSSEIAPLELAEPSAEAHAYAEVVAGAVAEDAAADPPPGPLVRAVVRWFWNGDPLYLTLHLLGEGDERPADTDAWYPLEWENADREFERTDRVLARADVQRAGAALAATLGGEDDAEAHVPAVIEIVRRLPAALTSRGLPLTERFAAAAAHFEGWGALETLEPVAAPELIAELRRHHELPD